MNTKMKMRMLSLLLCFVMLVGLMPTTVLAAEKNKISEFEATATLPDKLYVGMNLYDPNLLETISFNTTKGAPAKLDASSPWMYYNEETGYYERIYKNDDEQIVKAGVRYVYAAQLRIDGVDYETNTLAQHVDVKINGVLWNTSEDPYESSTVTYTWTQSPDFEVSNEPYRQKIPRISATVYGYQNTYFYGDSATLPSGYEVTVGIPAKFDDTTDVWQKKNGDTWEDYTEDTFKGGTYRLKVKLVVDGEDNDTHYLNDGIWGAINGTTMSSRYWHSLDTPTHTANSSYVWMVSPEHIIEGPASYTVAFDANGGTGNMASVNNVSGNYTLPPNGFTPPANKQFKCWSVNGNDKNPFESISVTANVTVKAIWKDIETTSYAVSFDSNGGSGSMASVTNAPSLYTLPQNGFTPPANKQFKCWAIGAQNDEYDPGDKITITANVTVKAVWEAITPSRQVISDVVAISSNLDTIPTLYGLLKIPTFTVTKGAPAYINASTSNLRWQKKIEGVWTNQISGRFTPGEWRISSSLRIDGTDGYYYELGNPTTLTVNGQAWTVENNGKPSVHPDYSHANILSPVFTIVDDPNVQPPIEVPSVDMILKGYQAGAQISAVTVETDAMVDVTVQGVLKAVDTNGDGQPDSSSVATGAFEENVMYAITISLRAKNGYDISGLTAQTVSLDRSLVDVVEEHGQDETFSGLYMLDDIIQYTVSFETNGGSAIDPVKVSRGRTLILPAEPTRAYYAFASWYEDEALTQAFDPSAPITANKTLYAKWTPSPVGGMFLMTIDLNGGTSTMPTSGEVPANSAIHLQENLGEFVTPPTGKVLAGYEINGVPYNFGADYLVTQNITLKFLWKDAPVTTYTIDCVACDETYKELGGGTVYVQTDKGSDSGNDYANGIATKSTNVTINAVPAAGYKFLGWKSDMVLQVSFANTAEYTFAANENLRVYAVFVKIPNYTVTFDSNGGSAVTAQTIEEGQKATKPADPAKSGYDFKGWTLNGSAYDFNTAVNGNITLVATWEQQQVVPTTYTVSFAANGGTGTMADVTGISGEYTLPENGFTAPVGKQFKAWSVGGAEKAVGDKITVTANITVTAVWETIPAGHTCDIKPVAKVNPSCTEGGKEAYYKCEGCGKFYEDALGAKEITDLAAWGNLAKLGHTESDWKSDKDNHWKECTVAACGVIIANTKAAHADANNDGKCDTCEYNVGTTTTNPDDTNNPDDTTKPEDTNKPSDDVQSPQTGDNSMMWLWIALLFVSGFGVVATTVIGKKRSVR